jgi:hypothetical protein
MISLPAKKAARLFFPFPKAKHSGKEKSDRPVKIALFSLFQIFF